MEEKKNKKKIILDPKANDKNLEKYLYGLVQDLFPETEFMEWEAKDPTQPPESKATIVKCCHYEIWYCVMNHFNPAKRQIKGFSPEALSFVRQVAVVLMKVNEIIT